MANLTRRLTSISPDHRSSPPPGRRLLALVLSSMLVLTSVFPGVALAGEADSEGEGATPPIEVPVSPDFDPGGEEDGLEETPASGGEEDGLVEPEPEVDIEAPPPEEVTGATPPVEAPPPPPVTAPEPASPTPEPEPEPVQQPAAEPENSEPVANQSITAPKQRPAQRHTPPDSAPTGEAPPPTEPAQQEVAPPTPQPIPATPADPGRNLAGRDTYIVRPGDCLWQIAADLLRDGADTQAVEREVARLWRLNEDRIGTNDPNLIYAGTELRLR